MLLLRKVSLRNEFIWSFCGQHFSWGNILWCTQWTEVKSGSGLQKWSTVAYRLNQTISAVIITSGLHSTGVLESFCGHAPIFYLHYTISLLFTSWPSLQSGLSYNFLLLYDLFRPVALLLKILIILLFCSHLYQGQTLKRYTKFCLVLSFQNVLMQLGMVLTGRVKDLHNV